MNDIGHKSLPIIIGPYMSPAMKNWFLIGTLIEDFVEMKNMGLGIRETMWIGAHKLDLNVFQFYKMLQQYVQAKHTRKPFKCDQCKYAHAKKSGLKKNYILLVIIEENLSKMKHYLVFWMWIYNMLF